ncbi:uncharacterized protein MCYG_06798 [Microsporum canis CBS 113480]|uniref:Uncharacterized protein n=1 Tax=Arthroderma otae (strain ATCC MYA-4605 / CBS 113480) TaxID=554155 RepID=C5FVP5_ARTOC|nr:uncharacterized protein MCYG_06798 [Microsporum canis CBS 113480]EEQ33979.1 predicted protein [Microsporum canis CBS 113480]
MKASRRSQELLYNKSCTVGGEHSDMAGGAVSRVRLGSPWNRFIFHDVRQLKHNQALDVTPGQYKWRLDVAKRSEVGSSFKVSAVTP